MEIGSRVRVTSEAPGSHRDGQVGEVARVSEAEDPAKQRTIVWVRFGDGLRIALYPHQLTPTEEMLSAPEDKPRPARPAKPEPGPDRTTPDVAEHSDLPAEQHPRKPRARKSRRVDAKPALFDRG